jgi:pyrimidine-specific ribonucleoside hydrolase
VPTLRPVALAVALLCHGATAKDVWIDTDPAIGSPIREVDDGFALILAFHSPELHIAGISTTFGNAPLVQTTRVARELVARFGKSAGVSTSDVFAGAASASALGQPTEATAALVAASRKQPLTYIALGPLTNLGTALRAEPALASRLRELIIVGGRSPDAELRFGRWLKIHDANMIKDPAAVRVVLAAAVPITLVPIESALALDAGELDGLRGRSPASDFLFNNSRMWWWFWNQIGQQRAAPVFDAGAVLAAARPDLALKARRSAAIDPRHGLIASRAPGRAVAWCTSFARSAKPVLLRRLVQRGN